MKNKKPFLKNFSLKTKIFFLIFLVLLYILIVVAQYLFRHHSQEQPAEAETSQTDQIDFSEAEDTNEKSIIQTEVVFGTDVSETEGGFVKIGNLIPLASQVIGSDHTDLLEKKLYEYNQANGIKSGTAILLEVAPSMLRDKNVEFYVENDDGSLVTLFWDPYQLTVDAQNCQYTKEEIEKNVWMFSEGEPENHGISQEEEQKILESQSAAQSESAAQTETTPPAQTETSAQIPMTETEVDTRGSDTENASPAK